MTVISGALRRLCRLSCVTMWACGHTSCGCTTGTLPRSGPSGCPPWGQVTGRSPNTRLPSRTATQPSGIPWPRVSWCGPVWPGRRDGTQATGGLRDLVSASESPELFLAVQRSAPLLDGGQFQIKAQITVPRDSFSLLTPGTVDGDPGPIWEVAVAACHPALRPCALGLGIGG